MHVTYFKSRARIIGREYTVLEFRFRSAKYTVVTRLHNNFEQLSIPIQTIQCSDVNIPIQNVFKRVYTLYNYSNCTINQLLYC